jgi:hypothetical protein
LIPPPPTLLSSIVYHLRQRKRLLPGFTQQQQKIEIILDSLVLSHPVSNTLENLVGMDAFQISPKSAHL